MDTEKPSVVRDWELDLDEEDIQRYAKRPKLDSGTGTTEVIVLTEQDNVVNTTTVTPHNDAEVRKQDHVLPPSHALLGIPLPEVKSGVPVVFLETDVGISEYVSKGIGKIEGIIKQRFTDFLVNEIDQDGNVIHLKNIGHPDPSATPVDGSNDSTTAPEASTHAATTEAPLAAETTETAPTPKIEEDDEGWSEKFTARLSQFLSFELVAQLKQIYLEGPEPPRISDAGWAGRTAQKTVDSEELPLTKSDDGLPERFGKRGRGRDKRGGRDGREGGGRNSGRQDNRKVVSDPIDSKETRTELHKAVRELFKGQLDSETDPASVNSEEGARIAIRWAKTGRGGRGGGGGGRGGRGRRDGDRPSRGNFPPYIHFSMQKTNRDTQDALGHLARTLHVNVKDLSVAGTKDKRGVTVQRVSLRRNNKTVEDIWKIVNGVGRRSHEEITSHRGERGVRLADLKYRKAGLELGMLKGNSFVITLRNVKVESMNTLNAAMNSMKDKGFINYYGMQRFGTASVPTHAIGLALLKSDWHSAVSLILQHRPGEHPDVVAARDAWFVEKDLEKALELMPRRVVAERCILESYKKQKGDTRNAMGALSTIPRNLRLMYVHAYQSYVWNAIVSERIRTLGAERPVVGDLVFENARSDQMDVDVELDGGIEDDVREAAEPTEGVPPSQNQRKKRPYIAPKIKTLTESDLDEYTIFDVVMPLPGTDVAYPGGDLGKRYREFLAMDGLDPGNFLRKQKEYTLHGSYRAILHRPKSLSWKVLRYTDPDVPLAQADEDKLLSFDPPRILEDGKFLALQVEISLGTASYATMALREITKTETSSQFQTTLTQAAADQRFRGYEGGNKEGA